MKVKRKRRKAKPTARAERLNDFLADILSAIISGLITAVIIKWFGW